MADTLANSLLALLFVVVALVLTFLMFSVWRYPYDHQKLKSAAPAWMSRSHRLLGFVYVALYVYMMWEMVPRLWDYQVELPARTVFHLAIGLAIGAMLIVKLAVVRFFKHLEARLAPILGTMLLIASLLLVSLALPFALREVYLSETLLDARQADQARIERVRRQLPQAGIEDPELIQELASAASLEAGRRVLTSKCTQCHDLRTVLVRPRTPRTWRQTVARMADRSTVLNPITAHDERVVTAYLIAVSPTLQQTLKQRRDAQLKEAASQQAVREARETMTRGQASFDLEASRRTFRRTCSQCHELDQVAAAPPETFEEVVTLVQRMVGNGLNASELQLDQVMYYLAETYVPGGFESVVNDTGPASGGAGDEPGPPADGATGERDAGASGPAPGAPDGQGAGRDGAAAVARGEVLFQDNTCFSCHGPQGRRPIAPHIPRLAGQNEAYLARQLRDIKSGVRDNGATAQMAGVVARISDDDIPALAAYLSSLEWSAP